MGSSYEKEVEKNENERKKKQVFYSWKQQNSRTREQHLGIMRGRLINSFSYPLCDSLRYHSVSRLLIRFSLHGANGIVSTVLTTEEKEITSHDFIGFISFTYAGYFFSANNAQRYLIYPAAFSFQVRSKWLLIFHYYTIFVNMRRGISFSWCKNEEMNILSFDCWFHFGVLDRS